MILKEVHAHRKRLPVLKGVQESFEAILNSHNIEYFPHMLDHTNQSQKTVEAALRERLHLGTSMFDNPLVQQDFETHALLDTITNLEFEISNLQTLKSTNKKLTDQLHGDHSIIEDLKTQLKQSEASLELLQMKKRKQPYFESTKSDAGIMTQDKDLSIVASGESQRTTIHKSPSTDSGTLTDFDFSPIMTVTDIGRFLLKKYLSVHDQTVDTDDLIQNNSLLIDTPVAFISVKSISRAKNQTGGVYSFSDAEIQTERIGGGSIMPSAGLQSQVAKYIPGSQQPVSESVDVESNNEDSSTLMETTKRDSKTSGKSDNMPVIEYSGSLGVPLSIVNCDIISYDVTATENMFQSPEESSTWNGYDIVTSEHAQLPPLQDAHPTIVSLQSQNRDIITQSLTLTTQPSLHIIPAVKSYIRTQVNLEDFINAPTPTPKESLQIKTSKEQVHNALPTIEPSEHLANIHSSDSSSSVLGLIIDFIRGQGSTAESRAQLRSLVKNRLHALNRKVSIKTKKRQRKRIEEDFNCSSKHVSKNKCSSRLYREAFFRQAWVKENARNRLEAESLNYILCQIDLISNEQHQPSQSDQVARKAFDTENITSHRHSRRRIKNNPPNTQLIICQGHSLIIH